MNKKAKIVFFVLLIVGVSATFIAKKSLKEPCVFAAGVWECGKSGWSYGYCPGPTTGGWCSGCHVRTYCDDWRGNDDKVRHTICTCTDDSCTDGCPPLEPPPPPEPPEPPECIDIGLRVYDGTAAVSICAYNLTDVVDTPLRMVGTDGTTIYKVGLVDPSDPTATNYLINLPDGTIKALKAYSSSRGRFVCKRGPPKYGWTWIATITCQAKDGTTKTINSGANSVKFAKYLWNEVYIKYNDGSRSGQIELPPKSQFQS